MRWVCCLVDGNLGSVQVFGFLDVKNVLGALWVERYGRRGGAFGGE